jgi:hypothetical protein
MHPIAGIEGRRDSSLNLLTPAEQRASAAPTAPRPRLVVIAGLAQDGDRTHDPFRPRQTAVSGHAALRDRASSLDEETIRFGRAPAARRKNRPR